MKPAALLMPVLLLCIQVKGYAQDRRYVVKHFTTENGLPQNSIKNIAFDSLGYCWIGTENGLAKYDGISFNVFSGYDIPPQSPRVRNIRKNREGKVLITFEMGEQYLLEYAGSMGMKPVFSKATYLTGKGESFVEVKSPVQESQLSLLRSISKNPPLEGYLMDERHFFIMSADTVRFISGDGREGFVKTGLDGPNWYVPVDGRLLVFSGKKNAVSVNMAGKVAPLKVKGDFFDAISPGQENFSLIYSEPYSYGFLDGDLYRLIRSGDLVYSEKVLGDLGTNSIYFLYYDAVRDHYYLQSQLDGLYIAVPRRFQNVALPEQGNWRFNSFYGQNRYQSGGILANGHLFTFKPGEEAPETKRVIPISNSLFSALLEGDSCYYQEHFNLYAFNIRTGKGRTIAFLNDLSHCILRSDYDSKIYFSTTDKLFALEGDTTRLVSRLPPTPNLYIYSFKPVSDDRALLATSAGLWEVNLKNGKPRLIIPGMNVRNIYPGKDGYIWLGSYNKGAWLMKNGRYRQLPYDLLNRMTVVNSIFEDKHDRIWFSTNNGLLYTDRQPAIRILEDESINYLRYAVFDKSDGLITNEFNGGATPDKVYLEDGRISIPSLKSLVVFNPDDFPPDTARRQVFIERISIDGQPLSGLSGITLKPEYRSMRIAVSSPWPNKRETLNFEWSIKGKNNEWISAAYGEPIMIRGYPYGDYTLVIRLKGDPESALELPFSVGPFFYETAAFRGGAVLLFVLAILGFLRLSLNRFRKKNTALEKKIQERTKELNDSLKSLNATVDRLKNTELRLHTSISQKDRIINMLLHDMKSPLFALKNGIEELDDKLSRQGGIQEEVLQKSGLLREGIRDVYSFSVNFFDWVKYQKEGIAANYQQTSLQKVFMTISELYGAIAAKKGILLLYDTEDIIFYTDENILITIIRNLVDNAIKNTTSGIIRLFTEVEKGEYVTITVHDSGPGMPPEVLEAIETAFQEETEIVAHAGYGYKIILHLVDLIHADLELKNSDGLQVRITLNYITGLEPEK